MTEFTRRLFLAAGAAAAATQVRAQSGAWTPRAPMPWPAQEIYGALWRGRVVVAGGLQGRERGFDILGRTAIYEPAEDRWTEGPRLPQPTHHPVLAGAEGRVFAFGGYRAVAGGQWSAVRDVLAFDGHRWTPSGRMPAPQSETTALVHGARVHLLGGRAPAGRANAAWNDQRDVATHRVFDAASRRWSTARPLPAPRNSAAGAVIGDALYLVGGRTVGGGNLARLDRYDPKADRWDALRPIPQDAGGLAAGALNGRLIAFGGEFFEGEGGVYRHTFVYDPGTDAWTEATPMRTPRHGLVGISFGGSVLAIGGATRRGASDTSAVVEAWRP